MSENTATEAEATSPVKKSETIVSPADVKAENLTEAHEAAPNNLEASKTPEVAQATIDTPNFESSSETSKDSTVSRTEDAIIFRHPDGSLSAVSAHPPSIDTKAAPQCASEANEAEDQVTTHIEAASTTPEVARATVDTPNFESSSETSKDSTVLRTEDAIIFRHPDGSLSAVSANPPSIDREAEPQCATEANEAEDQATNQAEAASSDGFERSDASVISVVPNVITSPVAGAGNLSEDGVTKLDSAEEPMTEPTMHVIDPCTEVPEPVGTPKASRSKITESKRSGSTGELNVAQLVDAVVVREAVLEEIDGPKYENADAQLSAETQSDARPKRPPPPVVVSSAQGQAGKKHHGLHFRFGGSKSREASLERRTFGSSVRNAFGTLTRSIKNKQRQMHHNQHDHHHRQQQQEEEEQEPQVTTVKIHSSHARPPRPTEQPHDYHEQQSLQSESVVSLTSEQPAQITPNQKRRRFIRSTAPDFLQALPPDDPDEQQAIYVNHSMQPNHHQSNEANVSELEINDSALAVNLEANQSDKTFELHQDPSSSSSRRHEYKNTASLDRRQYDSLDRAEPKDMRRAQTMRTADYAGRLRERLRTFRGGSAEVIDESGGSGTLRVTKPRSKPENYVCSETIQWPSKLLKLKRRQTTPAKTVHSTPNETVIPRPQPRMVLSYHPPPPGSSIHRPSGQEEVIISQTVMVQGKPPRAVSMQRSQSAAVKGTRPETPRQLTSLQTLAASAGTQRCTALPESPQRGLIQMMDAALDSPTQEHEVTVFPYLSNEMADQIGHAEKILKVDTDASKTCADRAVIEKALNEIHPFMSAWSKPENEEKSDANADQSDQSTQKTEPQTQVKRNIQDYLNICVRLRSVDLQGHFAPFHYPLHSFDASLWHTCARFVPWNNLPVIREPGTTTEYVQLPFSERDSANFIYPDRPIETLLTNWLDCHQTSTLSGHPDAATDGDQIIVRTGNIYHPILLAVTMDQLLSKTDGNQPNEEKEEVADTCFRLATLLSYEHCTKCLSHAKHSSKISPNLNEILALLSNGNCLILFKKQAAASSSNQVSVETAAQDSGTPTADEDKLVKLICPEQKCTGDAIDALINKLNTITTRAVHRVGWSPGVLLKAIAPPDWMVACSSRIYLKQQ